MLLARGKSRALVYRVSSSVVVNEPSSSVALRLVSIHRQELNHLWAVVLAGGDGVRLRKLTREISGDSRPKQFCNLLGCSSLLTETRMRVDRIVHRERQLFVVTKPHERWYRQDLADVDTSRVLVQPSNRGTGVAIALGIIEALQADPDAVVAFFPCDHYHADESSFRAAIRSATGLALRFADSIVVVGAGASYAEAEFGWIEPGPAVRHHSAEAYRVRRFREKPSLEEAEKLFRGRALWNTFLTVGRATTYLDLLCLQAPNVILQLVRTLSDSNLCTAYQVLPEMDFSRDVLAPNSDRLLVLCDRASGWLDIGSPARLLDVLIKRDIRPEWLKQVNTQLLLRTEHNMRPLHN